MIAIKDLPDVFVPSYGAQRICHHVSQPYRLGLVIKAAAKKIVHIPWKRESKHVPVFRKTLLAGEGFIKSLEP